MAIKDAILEVMTLTHGEAAKHRVLVRTQLAEGLPPVEGDRVQLQQVILNLVVNAFEAMSGQREARELLDLSRESRAGRRSGRGRGFGSGRCAGAYRAPVRGLLHDQAHRNGYGSLDLPLHHRGSRRTIVGEPERPPRRRLPIHGACLCRRRVMNAADPRCGASLIWHGAGGQKERRGGGAIPLAPLAGRGPG